MVMRPEIGIHCLQEQTPRIDGGAKASAWSCAAEQSLGGYSLINSSYKSRVLTSVHLPWMRRRPLLQIQDWLARVVRRSSVRNPVQLLGCWFTHQLELPGTLLSTLETGFCCRWIDIVKRERMIMIHSRFSGSEEM
jgi:hypothetical protein